MITNQAKPVNSILNSVKESIGITWGSITTSWATEPHTWLGVSQLITNEYGDRGFGLWLVTTFPWLLLLPWASSSGMTNEAKPS